MLCSRFLKPPHTQKHGALYNATERMFDALAAALRLDAARQPRASTRVTMAVSLALLVGTVYLFMHGAEGLPAERGSGPLQHQHRGDSGHRLRRDGRATRCEVADDRRQGSRRRSAFSNNVGGGPAAAAAAEHRPDLGRPEAARRAHASVDQIIADLRPKLAQVPGVRVFMVNQPPINLGGQGAQRSLYQFTLQDTDTDGALPVRRRCSRTKMRELPGIEDVSSDLQLKNPQIRIDMDRDQISALGLTVEPGRDGALQRLRHAAGVADLRAEQSVPGDPAGGAGVPERSGGAVDALRALDGGRLIPLEHGRHRDDRRRAVGRQPHRAAAVGDDLVQPQAGLRARRRGRRDSSDRGRDRCRRRSRPRSRARRRRSRIRCRASA